MECDFWQLEAAIFWHSIAMSRGSQPLHRAQLVDCRFPQIKGFQKLKSDCDTDCCPMSLMVDSDENFFRICTREIRTIFHEINFLKSWEDFFLKKPACSCCVCVCLMHISLQQMLGVAFVSTMRTFAWIRLRCFFDGLYHCTT